MKNNIKLIIILLLVTIALTGCVQNSRQPQISDKSSDGKSDIVGYEKYVMTESEYKDYYWYDDSDPNITVICN